MHSLFPKDLHILQEKSIYFYLFWPLICKSVLILMIKFGMCLGRKREVQVLKTQKRGKRWFEWWQCWQSHQLSVYSYTITEIWGIAGVRGHSGGKRLAITGMESLNKACSSHNMKLNHSVNSRGNIKVSKQYIPKSMDIFQIVQSQQILKTVVKLTGDRKSDND